MQMPLFYFRYLGKRCEKILAVKYLYIPSKSTQFKFILLQANKKLTILLMQGLNKMSPKNPSIPYAFTLPVYWTFINYNE